MKQSQLKKIIKDNAGITLHGIAKILNCSKRAVERKLNEMDKKGLIKSETVIAKTKKYFYADKF